MDKILDTTKAEIEGMRKGAIKKDDVDALETSYKDKLQANEDKYKSDLEKANGSIKKMLVNNVAQAMAAEISNAPGVILPHILERLTTGDLDGETITRVLDKQGKPSAATIEDLKAEFRANDNFAAIIVASKASGGGAGDKKGGAGGGSGNNDIDWSKASTSELAAKIKADRIADGKEV